MLKGAEEGHELKEGKIFKKYMEMYLSLQFNREYFLSEKCENL